jgi:TPR repeat protein
MLWEELRRFVDQIEAHEPAEAAAWAEARVESGDADAQFLMGLFLIHAPRSSFRDACAWYERAAAQDHAEDIYEIFSMSSANEIIGDSF